MSPTIPILFSLLLLGTNACVLFNLTEPKFTAPGFNGSGSVTGYLIDQDVTQCTFNQPYFAYDTTLIFNCTDDGTTASFNVSSELVNYRYLGIDKEWYEFIFEVQLFFSEDNCYFLASPYDCTEEQNSLYLPLPD